MNARDLHVFFDPVGLLIKGLQDVFPEQKPINRTYINTWEDSRVVDAVKKTGEGRSSWQPFGPRSAWPCRPSTPWARVAGANGL